MTASAWRTSAGTAARLRVARCTNLVRTLKDYAAKGLMIVGLDADGTVDHRRLRAGHRRRSCSWSAPRAAGWPGSPARSATSPCRIPMARAVESLNASVAAGVVLAKVAARRRVEQPAPTE